MNLKKCFTTLFLIFFTLMIVNSVYALDEIVLGSGENDPGTHNWVFTGGPTMHTVKVWKLFTSTDTTWAIDEVMLESMGSGNELEEVVSVVLMRDNDLDGIAEDLVASAESFTGDNGLIIFDCSNGKLVSSGTPMHLHVIYQFDSDAQIGSEFMHRIKNIKYHNWNNELETSQTSIAYTSQTTTVAQKYVIDLIAEDDSGTWAIGTDYEDGQGIINSELQGWDFAFRVYNLSEPDASNDFANEGGYTIFNTMPIGQEFVSSETAFSGISAMLRISTGSNGGYHTLKLRKDTIDGEIVAEAARFVPETDGWYTWTFFDFLAVCGDGEAVQGEACDTDDLHDKTCADFDYVWGFPFTNGTLSCTETCGFDFSLCEFEPTCGNEIGEPGEECELAEHCDAAEEGFEVSCDACVCVYTAIGAEDDEEPVVAECGNSVLEEDEACDVTELNGKTCTDFGFDAGTLACTDECIFNTDSCEFTEEDADSVCGNEIREAGERCDGDDLGSFSCGALGYAGGIMTCMDDCNPDLTYCYLLGDEPESTGDTDESGDGTDGGTGTGEETAAMCGNELLEIGEECDGENMGGIDCSSMNWGTGNLKCSEFCTLNREDCVFDDKDITEKDNSVIVDSGSTGDGQLRIFGLDVGTFVALIVIIAILITAYFYAKKKGLIKKMK
ncbi:MAG: hypothetical protein V1672_04200 [Candidatus Diapherotrites archaeon]